MSITTKNMVDICKPNGLVLEDGDQIGHFKDKAQRCVGADGGSQRSKCTCEQRRQEHDLFVSMWNQCQGNCYSDGGFNKYNELTKKKGFIYTNTSQLLQ